jgi:hypothetical protein
MAEEKLVTIAQFANYIEAEMAKQLLADYGIEAIVTGENASVLYPAAGTEGPELQVLESQAQKARQILESQKKQDTLEADNDSELQEGEDSFQANQEQ